MKMTVVCVLVKISFIKLIKYKLKVDCDCNAYYSLCFKLDVQFQKITQFKKSGCSQINCNK